ncbi:MAG: hypothetical protein LYZ66_03145 [Nitrososphaerales archaeon]|nr:hypothetical protein [Nitrososphaerales archaeon]
MSLGVSARYLRKRLKSASRLENLVEGTRLQVAASYGEGHLIYALAAYRLGGLPDLVAKDLD